VPFNPEDFYKLADWLAGEKSGEASFRAAISRVYYAAHLIAAQRLEEKKWWEPTGGGQDHDRLIKELRSRRTRTLGDKLKRLLHLRYHADYHLEAQESVRNSGCEFCQKMRETSSLSASVTNRSHWEEARTLSSSLLSLLKSL
jgi:hypothetical protein